MNTTSNSIENIYTKTYKFYLENWKAILQHGLVYYALNLIITIVIMVITLIGAGQLALINKINLLKPTDTADIITNLSPSQVFTFLGVTIFGAIIASLIVIPVTVNFYHAMLELAKGRQTDLLDTKKPYVSICINYIVYSACVAIGAMFLVIPGIILGIRLFPVLYISLEEQIGLEATFKKAWNLTKNSFWFILGCGAIPVVIYLIISAIISSIAKSNNVIGYIMIIPTAAIELIYLTLGASISIFIYKHLQDNSQKTIEKAAGV
jgi:hypothetical protein